MNEENPLFEKRKTRYAIAGNFPGGYMALCSSDSAIKLRQSHFNHVAFDYIKPTRIPRKLKKRLKRGL